jgi:SAM-dependent methyltransferase
MRPDITALAQFYASPAGAKLVAALSLLVTPLLRLRSSDRLLGFGFAQPFLPTEGPLVVQACPALQGVMRWPSDAPNRSCLVDDKHLPFTDALFDQVLLVHGLEYVEPARGLLRELWRVLAPGGQLLLLVPNRASLHHLLDQSPFANGRPYSGRQLQSLLQEALFTPLVSHSCVALPGMLSTTWIDRLLVKALPSSGGIHIILAQKQDGAAPVMAGKARQSRLALGTRRA